jgi:hypothetical protein
MSQQSGPIAGEELHAARKVEAEAHREHQKLMEAQYMERMEEEYAKREGGA